MLTCESVNRDTMTDLFSGSFNNLQLSMMEYLVKKKRKKRSLCQKRFRPFDQSVTRVWEVLNKVILGGRETTKGIFCTSGWGQQKLFWSLFLNYFTKKRDLASQAHQIRNILPDICLRQYLCLRSNQQTCLCGRTWQYWLRWMWKGSLKRPSNQWKNPPSKTGLKQDFVFLMIMNGFT